VPRLRVDTPVGQSPRQLVQALVRLVAPLRGYDRVAVGFPGVVRRGRVFTAVNLRHESWKGFDLGHALAQALGKPVRVANDADMQGLAAIKGKARWRNRTRANGKTGMEPYSLSGGSPL